MSEMKQISIDDAKDLIDGGDITIIDIRDQASYDKAHIENAISVGKTDLEDFIETADRETPVIVYCYHGNSSQGAAEYLCESGFRDVYSVMGGFEEWKTVYPTAS